MVGNMKLKFCRNPPQNYWECLYNVMTHPIKSDNAFNSTKLDDILRGE